MLRQNSRNIPATFTQSLYFGMSLYSADERNDAVGSAAWSGFLGSSFSSSVESGLQAAKNRKAGKCPKKGSSCHVSSYSSVSSGAESDEECIIREELVPASNAGGNVFAYDDPGNLTVAQKVIAFNAASAADALRSNGGLASEQRNKKLESMNDTIPISLTYSEPVFKNGPSAKFVSEETLGVQDKMRALEKWVNAQPKRR